MQIAIRSYLTAGIAVASAGVIAVTPIAPTLPDMHAPAVYMSEAAVDLAATVNPIEAWLQVLSQSVNNAVQIGGLLVNDPAPVLQQLIANQVSYVETVANGLVGTGQAFYSWATETLPTSLQTAVQAIAQGNITGAATAINDALGALLLVGFPLFDVLGIPGQMADNFARVVHAVTGLETLLPVIVGVLGPVEGIITAAGESGQAFVDAIADVDPIAALNAVVNTPAALTGALLNGYTAGDGSVFPGLLTVSDDALSAGLVQTLFVTIPKAIAAALAPPTADAVVTQAVTAVPKDTAKLVSVSANDEAAPAGVEKSSTAKSGSGVRASGKKSAVAAPTVHAQAAAAPSAGDNNSGGAAKANGGAKKSAGGAKGTSAKSAG